MSTSAKSDESSKFLERVAGVYKERFEARRGDTTMNAEHILEVVPINDHAAYVRLEIQDFAVGRIWGIATHEKNSLIYDNHDEGEGRCVVEYFWSLTEVTTKVDYAKTPGCSLHHGVGTGFEGQKFDVRKRQEIRYMQRLRDSKEFKEAVEEYQRFNPPQMPDTLQGKWIVTRVLPTARTIGCWGEAESKALLNTEIEYSENIFRWKDVITRSPKASIQVLTAERFHDENSGGGANSSQITLPELGIKSNQVTEVSIAHEPAKITKATIEIPGDRVLLKDNNTIILSVCGVYFEAQKR